MAATDSWERYHKKETIFGRTLAHWIHIIIIMIIMIIMIIIIIIITTR